LPVLADILAEIHAGFYDDEGFSPRAGEVILDCGANLGTFARYAFSRGVSRVIAVEPTPEALVCLRRNLEAEIQDGRAVVCESGLWDEETVLTLHVVPDNCVCNSFVEVSAPAKSLPAQEGPQIQVTTIDKLLDDLGIERLDFIKIDVEGAEQRVLAGAKRTLAAKHPRMSIATEHGEVVANALRVSEIVHETWPGYETKLGPTRFIAGEVQPQVLNFVPRQAE
jgi:FkbM family methyltransferase